MGFAELDAVSRAKARVRALIDRAEALGLDEEDVRSLEHLGGWATLWALSREDVAAFRDYEVARLYVERGAEDGPADARARMVEALRHRGWGGRRDPTEKREAMLRDFWTLTDPEQAYSGIAYLWDAGWRAAGLEDVPVDDCPKSPDDALEYLVTRYGAASRDALLEELRKAKREHRARIGDDPVDELIREERGMLEIRIPRRPR